MITNHEPIVPKCKGCKRIMYRFIGEKCFICNCCVFPRMEWAGGFDCSRCTTIERKPSEDPEEEGKYDNRSR